MSEVSSIPKRWSEERKFFTWLSVSILIILCSIFSFWTVGAVVYNLSTSLDKNNAKNHAYVSQRNSEREFYRFCIRQFRAGITPEVCVPHE